MSERILRVAALETAVHLGAVDDNISLIAAAIQRGGAAGARLMVLPELATSGYVFADAGEAASASLPLADRRIAALATTLAPGSVAVFGILEKDGEDLYNSAIVLEHRGIVGSYRKSHLWGREGEIFTPGTTAGTVIDTPIGRLGVAICYDNEFPEVPRRLALAGADILALPVNWPLVARPDGEHPPETIQAMGAARSSRLPTVIADRSGVERDVEWTGGTTVIDGDGWIAAAAVDGIALADLTIHDGDKTLPPHNDLFRDRRPDLY